MKSSDLIIFQQPKSQDKLDALIVFLKVLKIKFETTPENEIPIEHQNMVIERIKNSKEDELLDWENVKDGFDGI